MFDIKFPGGIYFAVVAGFIIGSLFGGGKTTVVVDPYAEERYLMEQERSKQETIQFCFGQCAKEWSQWETCTQS